MLFRTRIRKRMLVLHEDAISFTSIDALFKLNSHDTVPLNDHSKFWESVQILKVDASHQYDLV